MTTERPRSSSLDRLPCSRPCNASLDALVTASVHSNSAVDRLPAWSARRQDKQSLRTLPRRLAPRPIQPCGPRLARKYAKKTGFSLLCAVTQQPLLAIAPLAPPPSALHSAVARPSVCISSSMRVMFAPRISADACSVAHPPKTQVGRLSTNATATCDIDVHTFLFARSCSRALV